MSLQNATDVGAKEEPVKATSFQTYRELAEPKKLAAFQQKALIDTSGCKQKWGRPPQQLPAEGGRQDG
jgi:hypothetical protein